MAYKRANGTGTVYKLSGRRRNPYIAVITSGWEIVDGKARQKRHILGSYRTRNEAIIALSDYNKSPYNLSGNNMTLADVYNYWLENRAAKYAHNTLLNYRRSFNVMQPLHDMPYRQITAAHIDPIINVQPISFQLILKSFFKNMDETATRLDIPIKQIHSLFNINSYAPQEKTIFTDDEINKIWDLSDDTLAQVVLIYLYTGLRRNEFLEMKPENIDLKNWTMKGGEKTAAGKNRIVPIHTRIRPFIQRMVEEAQPKGIFVYNGKVFCPKYAYSLLHDYLYEHGIKHSIHECRHTFRTRLFNAGVNTLIIDRLCGHASNGSTGDQVYTHVMLEQLREAVEKLK